MNQLLRLVAVICCGLMALSCLGGAVYVVVAYGDLGKAGFLTASAAVPSAVIYEVIRTRDRGSVPPTVKILMAGVLASGLNACAGVQKTACAVWDGTHRVACELCERTEGGCPLGPEQGHNHPPEE